MLTARTFLVRGLLAGLVSGIVTFGAAYVFGEPSLDAAIAVEQAAPTGSASGSTPPDPAAGNGVTADSLGSAPNGDAASGDVSPHAVDSHQPPVSRSTQSTWGLATATVVFGTALGGIVGLAAAFALGRVGSLSPRATAGAVALLGFIAVYLVPYVKYPPNPPGVGNPDTIGTRTAWYFAMMAASVIAAVVALIAARRLGPILGGWYGALVATVGYGVVVAGVGLSLPAPEEVRSTFPADLLWNFRTAALYTQLVLWTVIGLVLAEGVHRAVRGARPQPEQAPAGSPA